MGEGEICQAHKKPVANRSPQQVLPLRHIELIAIWEGNYKPDIFNIGLGDRFLKGTVESLQDVLRITIPVENRFPYFLSPKFSRNYV
jgi:hypothetical protein